MQNISPEQANTLVQQQKAILFDVRSESEFAAAHLPGAVLLPITCIDHALATTVGDKEAIFYCTTGARTARAHKDITSAGLQRPSVIEGGLNAWQASGLQVVGTQAGTGTFGVPRQVQITIGVLIILFAALTLAGFSFAPYILGAIGIGLLFAGLTGTCAMASLILMMPWNQPKQNG